jgi:lipopolysaccharide biosynthesis regulator YciM
VADADARELDRQLLHLELVVLRISEQVKQLTEDVSALRQARLWWRCAGCGWRSWLHYGHCQQCGRDRPVAAPEAPQEQPWRA